MKVEERDEECGTDEIFADGFHVFTILTASRECQVGTLSSDPLRQAAVKESSGHIRNENALEDAPMYG